MVDSKEVELIALSFVDDGKSKEGCPEDCMEGFEVGRAEVDDGYMGVIRPTVITPPKKSHKKKREGELRKEEEGGIRNYDT
ncbi:hypothetical protein ACLOJK_023493 [Asimina triloba]